MRELVTLFIEPPSYIIASVNKKSTITQGRKFSLIISSLEESVNVMEFQAAEAYSSLCRITALYKILTLSIAEKENVI
jgi:hypothetical protein